MKLKNFIKRFFCTLSGDDYAIVRLCGAKLESRFAAIGAFVAAVFALCFVSAFLCFTKLFPNYWIGVPVALFFAAMITNIYLLLLYTLSKNVLPNKNSRGAGVFSTAVRVTFICLIAVVVSKPLEAGIFSAPLESEIERFKQQKIADYNQRNGEFFRSETEQLEIQIEKQEGLGADISGNERAEKYRKLLAEKQIEKARTLEQMRELIEHSNFYVESLIILNRQYPDCWLLSALCAGIFLAPAAIKNFLSEQSDFYRLKRRIEKGIVLGEYQNFKPRYRQILRGEFEAEHDFCEPFRDAPFNTAPKIDRTEFLAESDLIKEIYDA